MEDCVCGKDRFVAVRGAVFNLKYVKCVLPAQSGMTRIIFSENQENTVVDVNFDEICRLIKKSQVSFTA